jgi:cation:H+ antiporter
VAFGNVVGSNIANILLILGASAMVGGLAVQQRIVRFDVPLLVLASIVVFTMALDNRISGLDGAILAVGVVAYTSWLILQARSERDDISIEYAEAVASLEGAAAERAAWSNLLLVVAGLGVLVVGSQLLVNSATTIAEAAGVSDLVIGLTVVAVGTSLPELATSIMAVVRGQRDIAVGNVIGSNLFNLMSVLGVSAIVSPDGISVGDSSISLDLPVMLAATVVLLPILWNGYVITRGEGIILVGFYAAYVSYLVLDASDSGVPAVLGQAILTGAMLGGVTFLLRWVLVARRPGADSAIERPTEPPKTSLE